ncbi:MAG: EamA family transporter [Planctomycetota bacterium]|jgi:uncharacterized membrane protein
MWAVYALLSAFGWASSDAFAKRAMEGGADGRFILFARYAAALPLLAVLLAVTGTGVPDLGPRFFLLHLPWVPLEAAALYLYIHAIRVSPLSLTLPFLSLTPLFLILTAWIFLGEAADASGVLGILLVVAGSYLLNLDGARGGRLAPFRAVLKEPGSRAMVIAALLYSLTAVLGKVLVAESGPVYFSAHYTVVMAVAMAPLGLRRARASGNRARAPLILLSALFFSVMTVFHMLALPLVEVAYLISLKRFSGVIGVVYGAAFFGEKGVRHRLPGSLMMVAGGAIIVL